jgi:hypothetical protein
MTSLPAQPWSSVPDLVAELVRVQTAIRRTRSPTSPPAGPATADDLLQLYARERAVVLHLRSRQRRWRAETRVSVFDSSGCGRR